jgi:hypothetical protein
MVASLVVDKFYFVVRSWAMLGILAAVFELFVDYAPPEASIDQIVPLYSYVSSELQKRGWELAPFQAQDLEHTWVFWNLGGRLNGIDWTARDPSKLILFAWEPPTVQPELYDPKIHKRFSKIFTWDDDLVDNIRFFKFSYPVLQARLEVIPSFSEKKFCTLIARRKGSQHPKELYSEREKTILFFEDKPGEFDLYGSHWEKRKYKNWKGAIPDKIGVLKNYKFAICYENMRDVKGYITEKIFDCFAAGVVPVYWGASNVADYIPESCFIDRRKFKSQRGMYLYLKRIREEEYQKYLDAAAQFLKSEKAKTFSSESFAQSFLQIADDAKPLIVDRPPLADR